MSSNQQFNRRTQCQPQAQSDPRAQHNPPARPNPRVQSALRAQSSTTASTSTSTPAPAMTQASTTTQARTTAPAFTMAQAHTNAPAPTMPRAHTNARAPTMPQAHMNAPAPTIPQAHTNAPAPTMPQAPAPAQASTTPATLTWAQWWTDFRRTSVPLYIAWSKQTHPIATDDKAQAWRTPRMQPLFNVLCAPDPAAAAAALPEPVRYHAQDMLRERGTWKRTLTQSRNRTHPSVGYKGIELDVFIEVAADIVVGGTMIIDQINFQCVQSDHKFKLFKELDRANAWWMAWVAQLAETCYQGGEMLGAESVRQAQQDHVETTWERKMEISREKRKMLAGRKSELKAQERGVREDRQGNDIREARLRDDRRQLWAKEQVNDRREARLREHGWELRTKEQRLQERTQEMDRREAGLLAREQAAQRQDRENWGLQRALQRENPDLESYKKWLHMRTEDALEKEENAKKLEIQARLKERVPTVNENDLEKKHQELEEKERGWQRKDCHTSKILVESWRRLSKATAKGTDLKANEVELEKKLQAKKVDFTQSRQPTPGTASGRDEMAADLRFGRPHSTQPHRAARRSESPLPPLPPACPSSSSQRPNSVAPVPSQGSNSRGLSSEGSDSQRSNPEGSDSQGSSSQGSNSEGSDSQDLNAAGSTSVGTDCSSIGTPDIYFR